MATPFFSLPSSRPDQSPTPSPKPQGRKNGANKSQNSNKEKTRRRGVGIAELERLRHLETQPPPSPPPPPFTTTNPIADTRVNPFHHSNPLSGVPVIRYCFPGQPITDPRLAQRADSSSSSLLSSELPSMPSPFHSNLSFKKKRVIGEEAVGFTKGYSGNFSGFDLKNNNGGFSAHQHPTTSNGSEVVAIHRKWSGANVMMEYGFFPGKPEENNTNNGEENMKFDTENYYKMEDLNLKMGFSDSLLSSPSSSSSLSSLITTSTTNTCNSSVDLSLKLSSY